VLVGKVNEADQVVNGAVHKDTIGVVAGYNSWNDGAGASGQDKDVVGDYLACFAVDCFGGTVNVDDFGGDEAA
jgi:hypothetical protein